jgi:hypothetical protein
MTSPRHAIVRPAEAAALRRRSRRVLRVLSTWASIAGLWLAAAAGAAGPRFLPDDPIAVDDDRALDARGAKEIDASNAYDFVEHTFIKPGERRAVPAANINTLGDVPDSSWFTNRIGAAPPQSLAEYVRGPDRYESLSVDGWPIVASKGEGRQGGWRVADRSGHIYQIEFDPKSNPEMATGAETIGTVFYHAFGYNVVEVYVVEVDSTRLEISSKATIRDVRSGKRRAFTREDVDDILRDSARQPNGKYRALASRFADGTPLGSFKYHGVRPDDPNDIFPHEHRRELRGARVFASWLGHDDSRGLNSLDMLETLSDGRKAVRHYMFDFGSLMGSGTFAAQAYRAGNEYIFEWRPSLLTFATLGLYLRPWLTIPYPDVPASVGRFEGERYDPVQWRPEYPNPAFDNMQPEDAFWGARIVSKFSDDMIRATVEKAKYSQQAATDYITKVLIQRRDKVLRTWLTAVNPIVNAKLDGAGQLTFENAVATARIAPATVRYTFTWYEFDNAADTKRKVQESVSAGEPRAQAPPALLSSAAFIAVDIATEHPDYPHWRRPATAYFRRDGGGWTTVGLDR